jgi:hypothetical protein
MNCALLKNRSLGLLCLCLLAWATPGRSQTNTLPAARTNRPAPERFLFIFDISSGMEKRATNVDRITGQLVASGLNGQLERGDTIGVWTYNNELHTGEFPLQRWTPQASREITIALVQFIQQQRYGKKSRLDPVMEQLTSVVAASDKITVILFSDGSDALTGTTFDTQIAEAFKLNAAEQRRLAMPFVTILRAAKGKFVSLKVNTPPWPVELPSYPGETTPTESIPTEPPPHIQSPTINKPVAPTALPKPATLPVATNATAPPPTNVLVVGESTPPPVTVPANPPPAVSASPAPVVTNVVPSQVEQRNRAAAGPAKPVAKPQSKLPLVPVLVGVGIILVGLAIACFVFLKRSRETPRVSLITRSMNKDRK